MIGLSEAIIAYDRGSTPTQLCCCILIVQQIYRCFMVTNNQQIYWEKSKNQPECLKWTMSGCEFVLRKSVMELFRDIRTNGVAMCRPERPTVFRPKRCNLSKKKVFPSVRSDFFLLKFVL